MRMNNRFQICTIAGKDFLIPVGTAVVNVQGIMDLNEVSSYILKLLKERSYSEEELVECVFSEYDAEIDTIRADISTFIKKGFEIGFLEV